MKISKMLSLLISLTILAPGLLLAEPPFNLQTEKKITTKYVESGEYFRDIQKAITPAKQYLIKRIKNNAKNKKLAIVLDIDETSVSNYPFIKKYDFGATPAFIEESQVKVHADPIKPTLRLYNFAKKHNVAVFFITGRKEKYREPTIKTLKRSGYKNWDGLFFKKNNYNKKSAIPYKSSTRKQLIQKGYEIVLTIGDQYSDLKGGYAERGVKLPDPFCILP